MRLVVDTNEGAQETLGYHELSIFEKPQKPSSFPDVVGILVDTSGEALRLRDAFAPKEPSADEAADDSNPYNAPDTLEADIYERLAEDIRLADGAKFSVRPLETRSEDLLRRAAMSLGAQEVSSSEIKRRMEIMELSIYAGITGLRSLGFGIEPGTILDEPFFDGYIGIGSAPDSCLDGRDTRYGERITTQAAYQRFFESDTGSTGNRPRSLFSDPELLAALQKHSLEIFARGSGPLNDLTGEDQSDDPGENTQPPQI